jgi:hypothetical protein
MTHNEIPYFNHRHLRTASPPDAGVRCFSRMADNVGDDRRL